MKQVDKDITNSWQYSQKKFDLHDSTKVIRTGRLYQTIQNSYKAEGGTEVGYCQLTGLRIRR